MNSVSDITIFAETNFRHQCRRFGIKTDDRRKHMYFIGKTGMGKSTTLENMIISDIRAGRGVGVVDPHGELIDRVLNFIPDHRINDVIYVNPADLDWPIGFNILEGIDVTHKHLIASGLMSVFTKIWENVWSARMEYILNNCILALLDSPGNTLLGINRIFVDKSYRKKIIANVKDPVVKSFWLDEYAAYNDRFRTEAIAPIQNKVGQFLSSAIIRNIVGQTESTIDMREIMDNGKIILMDLAKGRIGEDNSALLGAMMVTRLQLAAMMRVDIPEHLRRDFFLYVDEFQNFATESFASILSEARKYRLSLTLAHQYIAQLDETVQAAIFGNVGTIISYRVGAADAAVLALEFAPQFTEEDFVNLSKYDVYMKLMIDGVSSKPFSATTLPPLSDSEKAGNRDKVIRVSREHYSRPRLEVEEKIERWSGFFDEASKSEKSTIVIEPAAIHDQTLGPREKPILEPHPSGMKKRGRGEKKGREGEVRKTEDFLSEEIKKSEEKIAPASPVNIARKASCSFCGSPTTVYFKPESGRPVYCKDCWKKKKSGELDQVLLDALKEKGRFDESEGITLKEALAVSPPPGARDVRDARDERKEIAGQENPKSSRRRRRRKKKGGMGGMQGKIEEGKPVVFT